MIPVTFNKCFGLLHLSYSDNGIVFCNPFGFEELGIHRSLYHLANEMSQNGFTALRFDYEGTNNSLEDESDPLIIDNWIQNIVQAVDFLRNKCGIKNVTLIGFRLGATLISLAVQKLDNINQIILVSPIISGRSYVRTLKVLSNAWQNNYLPHVEKHNVQSWIDLIGNRVYLPALQSLSEIDLKNIELVRLKRILIISEDIKSISNSIILKVVGDIDLVEFTEYETFMRDSVSSILPRKAFNYIHKWLGDNQKSIPYFLNKIVSDPIILQDGCETGIIFGNNDLFGIISEPNNKDSFLKNPAVIILNTGPNHHVGNGRLGVIIARNLLNLKVTTLRFDLKGIGDSKDLGNNESSIYNLEAMADLKLAIDLLTKDNNRPIIVIGLCSGAYLALHSPVLDERISGIISTNLQKFMWKEGTSLQIAGKNNKKSTKFYIRSVFRKNAWQRILKREVDMLNTISTLVLRPLKRYSNSIINYINFKDTDTRKIRLLMKELATSNKKIQLWYSEDDPGLTELKHYFGSKRKFAKLYPSIGIQIIKNADHSLNSYDARIDFIDKLNVYMKKNFL